MKKLSEALTLEKYVNEYLARNANHKSGRRQNKYRNKKTVVDGKTFDSKAEAAEYLELKEMQSQGQISDLKLQVPFVLQEGFRDNMGKWQSPIRYIADFTYVTGDGVTIAMDVKSKITAKNPVYQIKKKLFKRVFPDIEFLEVVM